MQINRTNTYRLRLFALIIGLLFLSVNSLFATEVVEALQIDYKKDGKVISATFAFETNPKVFFEGETLYIQSESLTETYIIDDVVDFKFVMIDATAIEQLKTQSPANPIKFSFFSNELIKVTGDNLTPEVNLFTADGRQVKVQSDFSNNEINIHLEALPRGLYIIKTNHHSFKFIRK